LLRARRHLDDADTLSGGEFAACGYHLLEAFRVAICAWARCVENHGLDANLENVLRRCAETRVHESQDIASPWWRAAFFAKFGAVRAR
jgi:hypothetical protein